MPSAQFARDLRTVLVVRQTPLPRPRIAPRIVEVSGLAAADEWLAEHDAQLVIADLDLFDGSGLELLASVERARRTKGRGPRVLLLAAPSTRTRALLGRGNPWLAEDGADLGKLVLLAQSNPSPAPATLLDYCAMATVGVRAVELAVNGAQGAGVVRIRSNRSWTADDAKGEGVAAFLRLSRLATPLDLHCANLAEDVVLKSIAWSVDEVVELARTSDDPDAEQELADRVPPSHRVSGPRSWYPAGAARTLVGLASMQSDESFERLWERAVELMLEKRFPEAAHLLRQLERLRPDHPQVKTNLARLRTLGHA